MAGSDVRTTVSPNSFNILTIPQIYDLRGLKVLYSDEVLYRRHRHHRRRPSALGHLKPDWLILHHHFVVIRTAKLHREMRRQFENQWRTLREPGRSGLCLS